MWRGPRWPSTPYRSVIAAAETRFFSLVGPSSIASKSGARSDLTEPPWASGACRKVASPALAPGMEGKRLLRLVARHHLGGVRDRGRRRRIRLQTAHLSALPFRTEL